MKTRWTVFFSMLLLLFAASAGAEAYETHDYRDSQRSYGAFVAKMAGDSAGKQTLRGSARTSQTIVVLKTDGRKMDFQSLGAVCCAAGPGNRFTLAFSSMEAAQAAVSLLADTEGVVYAELDGEIAACDTAQPDEIGFFSYGAELAGFDHLLTWARKGGGAQVAIVDSGVIRHPFFASRLLLGWDYVDGDDDPTNDEFGHGTHVAGIVADCTQGAGVSLYAVRVMGDQGKGKASNAANGILEAVEAGIPIINLSFVSTTQSAFLDDAVQTAVASGCTVVIAAGNSGGSTANVWPAHLMDAGAIVVGAANADGSRASYSNYGASVDVYFYGSGIESCSNSGGYETKSGTSQATAHISAACALLSAANGGLSPETTESRLKSVLGGEGGLIPLLADLVPQRVPCHLIEFSMGVGENFSLPKSVLPVTCWKEITWLSSNENMIYVDENGELTAVSPGTAELTGTCANFEDFSATVTVTDAPSAFLRLPAMLTALEDEALLGVAADYLIPGDSLESIGENAVDAAVVMLCAQDSAAAEYAEANGIQYCSIPN